jgi:hypothetical protein
MKDSFFLEEEIRREDLAACSALLASKSDKFGALVAAAGMNPATDFVYADLRNCDFSNTDLRGFNFSGANLRGTVLRDTIWDRSTVLAGADIEGSGFKFDADQEKFFKTDAKSDRLARSLATADWIGVAVWLDKKRSKEEDARASRIAFEVYRRTEDSYVKSTILRHARHQFADLAQYRDFLLSELARPHADSLAVACLTILGRLFAGDPEVKAICGAMLPHQTEYVRRAALTAFMNGIRGTKLPPIMLEYIRNEDSGELRSYFITRLVRRMSDLHDLIARDGRIPGLHRDYRARVTEEMVDVLAAEYIFRNHTTDVELDELERKLPQGVKPGTNAAENYLYRKRARKKVKQLFEDFLDIGVPFNLAWRKSPVAPSLARGQ